MVAACTANHWSYGERRSREAEQSSATMLDWQSLGHDFVEAGGRLASLMVACLTANRWFLGS